MLGRRVRLAWWSLHGWEGRSRRESGPDRVLAARQPIDNAFAESFNGRFRDECLDRHWFASLEEARQIIEARRVDDSTERPHRTLGQQAPAAWIASRPKPPG